MKLLKFFLGLIAILFVLCLVTGCKAPMSFSFGYSSSNGWSIGPFQQYPDGRPTKVEAESKAEPNLEELDESSEEPITPPPSTGLKTRSGPVVLSAGEPTPIGPPGPGRQMVISLTWQHSPELDGTTEYRVYHSRQASGWDGYSTVQAGDFQASGRRYLWQYRQGGTIRFVATALRPPDVEAGETNWVESDQSNAITVRAKGIPEAPTELSPKR